MDPTKVCIKYIIGHLFICKWIGRQFWSCGSGKDCKFFQWADEDAPPQNQSGWGDNQNTFGSNGFGYSARGGTRKTGTKRKCSVCHREGIELTLGKNRVAYYFYYLQVTQKTSALITEVDDELYVISFAIL